MGIIAYLQWLGPWSVGLKRKVDLVLGPSGTSTKSSYPNWLGVC